MLDVSFRLTSGICFSVIETEHFINRGYGWLCKHCSERTDDLAHGTNARARFFTEGEAEEREPVLSASSLARWRDDSHSVLVCPHCGTEEGMRAEG